MNVNFQNILWMPIDLPKFPIKNFYFNPTDSWTAWYFKKLTTRTKDKYSSSNLRTDIIKQYPELVTWINLFPFTSLCNIKFNIQKDLVPPHIDFASPEESKELFLNNSVNEPCGYRVVIKGKRQNNIYIVKNETKHYVTLPEDTDVYVLGQTTCLHGVEEEPGRRTMYIQMFIEPNKHLEILNRSYKLYKDYAIFS